jgi:uncharacterized protein (TIGR03546 family)
MLVLKLIQSLFKTLHSDGTPGQVAAGLALGAILGLTPILNLHNALVFALILMLNVSFGGAMLGWALFLPIGFLLDPLFDRIGRVLLLETEGLVPLWTALANMPVVPLTNFNNTVVLGSVVFSVVAWIPVYLGARWGVKRYRETIGQKIMGTRLYKLVTTSKLYNIFRLFRPGGDS